MTIRSLAALLGVVLFISSFGISAAEEKPAVKDATFDLKEVSVFDSGNAGQSFWRAMNVRCSTEPFKEVKAYPKLNSKRPLYGKLQFSRTAGAKLEAPIYFVLDQSGESPVVAEAKKEEKIAEKKNEKAVAKKRAIARRPVVIKPSSYDRLHIDANRDNDLTNDPVLKPMKDPPWKLIPGNVGPMAFLASGRRPPSEKERMAFEPAAIDVDYGPGVGVRPFKVFPWFILTSNQETPTLRFAAATARKGTIKIGKTEYDALLTQQVLTGRFDCPSASVQLRPKSPSAASVRYPSRPTETLMTLTNRDGEFYTLLATPPGDKLTVQIYRGPFGVFKVGPGDRKLKDISFQGSFYGRKAFITVGPGPANSDGKKMSECKLPVGNYYNFYLSIDYGGLQVAVGSNYQRQPGAAPPQGLQIRADKPFVLDFPNKPEIGFQSPPADKAVKLGATVRIATLLVDPKLGIMVRGLTDPTRKMKKTFMYRVGKEMKEHVYEVPFSYEPTITITDSSGKNVAEGVMPFG